MPARAVRMAVISLIFQSPLFRNPSVQRCARYANTLERPRWASFGTHGQSRRLAPANAVRVTCVIFGVVMVSDTFAERLARSLDNARRWQYCALLYTRDGATVAFVLPAIGKGSQ